MEHKQDELIKALEIHTGILDMPCEECPYNCNVADEICLDVLTRDALALIKELTAENDKLYRLVDDKIQEIKKLTEHNAQILQFGEEWEALARKFEAENKRLKEDWANNQTIWEKNYDSVCDIVTRLETDLKNAKADTVRKMQERLKEKMHTNVLGAKFLMLYETDIDQIAKEMSENE